MPEVLFSLYRAAEDDRITGLMLDVRGVELDWAKVEEVRQAIRNFRDQGKPVVAYLDGGGTSCDAGSDWFTGRWHWIWLRRHWRHRGFC